MGGTYPGAFGVIDMFEFCLQRWLVNLWLGRIGAGAQVFTMDVDGLKMELRMRIMQGS